MFLITLIKINETLVLIQWVQLNFEKLGKNTKISEIAVNVKYPFEILWCLKIQLVQPLAHQFRSKPVSPKNDKVLHKSRMDCFGAKLCFYEIN